jgi:8-oxo-dGTP pyrophosphatase MutT (NUDIX family)
MRQSQAALAVIRRMDQGQPVWLAQWNRSWNAYALVGGDKRPTESFRDCLDREIAEELGWHEGADFTVAATPPVHLEFTAWSESAHQETAYTMELFEIPRIAG